MKLRVLQGERFSCHSCTNCCRNWHVQLLPGEAERLENLAWAADDPLRGVKPLFRHNGKTFIAHRENGDCIFLNAANGYCRIHEQFGPDKKPLGCRLFPFQIHSTFDSEITVIGRYDCPTIRRNEGAAHEDSLPELRRYANQLGLSEGLDEATCCHLDREQIEAVCEFILTLMAAFKDDAHRVLFIAFLCDRLAVTMADELDRQALAEMFNSIKEQVEAASTSQRVHPPNAFSRTAFRTLLGIYLRRDEEVLDRRASRVWRLMGFVKIILGYGSFRNLGLAHPPGKLSRAGLFRPAVQSASPEAFSLYWRLVRNRIESFQFMGPANSGRDFLNGLRSLALVYPLVRAVAKFNAGNRGSQRVEAGDVDYAVAAIEHSFGRLAVLNQPFMQSIEKLLLEPRMFARLVRTV